MTKNKVIDLEATGKKIKVLMDKKNMNIRELSNVIGMSPQTVSSYINGKSSPNIRHLFMIAKVLDTTMDDILVPNSYIGKLPRT